MFLGKIFHNDGGSKAEVTCSYAIQIIAVEIEWLLQGELP